MTGMHHTFTTHKAQKAVHHNAAVMVLGESATWLLVWVRILTAVKGHVAQHKQCVCCESPRRLPEAAPYLDHADGVAVELQRQAGTPARTKVAPCTRLTRPRGIKGHSGQHVAAVRPK